MLASGVVSVGYPGALLNAFPRDDHLGLDLMATSTACICSGSCFCRSFTRLSPARSTNTFRQTQRHVKISINAWGHGHPDHKHIDSLPLADSDCWDKSPPDVLLICWTDTEKANIIAHNEQHRAVNEMSRMWVGCGQEKQSGRRGRRELEAETRVSTAQPSIQANVSHLLSVFFHNLTTLPICSTEKCMRVWIKTPWTKHTTHVLMGQVVEQTSMNVPAGLFWGVDEDSVNNHVFSFTWKEENNVRSSTRSSTSAADNRQRSNSPWVKHT